jgi:hypothetical protein
MEMRREFGREGPFPMYAQVMPPADADAAKELVRAHAEAGMDGLILAAPGSVSGIEFLENEGAAKAVVEAAREAG